MHIDADGTFNIKGEEVCDSSAQCQGKMNEDEVRKLFQTIKTFGFEAFAASAVKCNKYEKPHTTTTMHLALGGKGYDISDDTACPDAATGARLKQFETDIDFLLAIDRRGARQAAIVDLESCKPPNSKENADYDGVVRLQFQVGADARLISAFLVRPSGNHALDELTLKELSKCQFKAGYRNGESVPSYLTIDYVWRRVD